MANRDDDDEGSDKTVRRSPSVPPPVAEPFLEPTTVRRNPSVPLPVAEPFLEPTTVRRNPSVPSPVAEPGFDHTNVRRVTSESDPLIGAMLGEYRVLAPLGEGGVGLVYRGEQPMIGRPVAIKVLKREYAQDPTHVRRFLEEARSVSAARHPGIIDVFSFGQMASGEPYLVMELLEGTPLDVLLRRQGALPVQDALALLIPVLSALGAAHAAGVTHRDLKPGNIFVVKLQDGTTFPKLLDFGLARRGAAGSMVRQTSVGGTPLYIAPEQARGEAVGPQTDLYSLGCVAYELLVGQPPFTALNLSELLDQHLTLAPEPPRQRAPEVPVELEELVLQMLQKDPAQRPASAAEVREQLERILVGLKAGAAPRRVKRVVTRPVATPAATSVALPQQRRAVWPFALGASVVLGLGGAGAWFAMTPAVAVPPPAPMKVTPVPLAAVPEPEPEPEVVPEPEAVPQPPVAIEPKPVPAVAPRAPRHTGPEVKRRWHELNRRAKTLPDDLRRAARLQLEEARYCTGSAEQCWRELTDLERTFFPR